MSSPDQILLPRIPRREMPQGFLEIQDKLAPLTRLQTRRTLWAIGGTWAAILAVLSLWYAVGSFWILPPVILVIGVMQHALAILAHEGVHGSIARDRKWNQRIASWFCAWPVSMNFEDYRYVHMQHHRYANDDKKDPDWIVFEEWHDMPKSKRWMMTFILKYLLGYGFIDAFRFKMNMHRLNPNRQLFSGDQLIFLVIAALAAIGFFYQVWWPLIDFFLLWIVPIHLVFYPMNLFRAMCEHYGMNRSESPSHLERMLQSRTIQAGFFERLFVAPFNVSYHLEHHLFDTIPFYNLPKASTFVHGVAEVKARSARFDSYLGSTGVWGQLFR